MGTKNKGGSYLNIPQPFKSSVLLNVFKFFHLFNFFTGTVQKKKKITFQTVLIQLKKENSLKTEKLFKLTLIYLRKRKPV